MPALGWPFLPGRRGTLLPNQLSRLAPQNTGSTRAARLGTAPMPWARASTRCPPAMPAVSQSEVRRRWREWTGGGQRAAWEPPGTSWGRAGQRKNQRPPSFLPPQAHLPSPLCSICLSSNLVMPSMVTSLLPRQVSPGPTREGFLGPPGPCPGQESSQGNCTLCTSFQTADSSQTFVFSPYCNYYRASWCLIRFHPSEHHHPSPEAAGTC